MTDFTDHDFALLKAVLSEHFVPHLPVLAPNNKTDEERRKKDLSRALSAFALSHLSGLNSEAAAREVVDDFEDCGIDAVHFCPIQKTLYIVQAKLKKGEEFQEAEAQKFVMGVRKLVASDFAAFNAHVVARQPELQTAIEDCDRVQLVVIYTGSRISAHASAAIKALMEGEGTEEARFVDPFSDVGPAVVRRVVSDFHAHKPITARLKLNHARKISQPRETYIGTLNLKDIVALFNDQGNALFDKNVRNGLGGSSEVNRSIQASLKDAPGDFLFLNNGITILSSTITERNTANDHSKTLDLRGISVVNGAQTIASAAAFAKSANADLDGVKVAATIIKAATDSEFGKQVTKARNYQNPIYAWNFAALDERQEIFRRAAKALGFDFRIKSHDPYDVDPASFTFDEVAIAMALGHPNPRMAWRASQRARRLQTLGDDWYEEIFGGEQTVFRVINRTLATQQVFDLLKATLSTTTSEDEKRVFRHGGHAYAWVLLKCLRNSLDGAAVIDRAKLLAQISKPADDLRLSFVEQTLALGIERGNKQPWAIFQNQSDNLALLERVMLANFGPLNAAAIADKRGQRPVTNKGGRVVDLFDYPEPLFTYLASKAPQIKDVI